MIQELFGGGVSSGLLNRDRNIPISGVVFEPSPSASPSPSPSSSTTVTTATDATPQPNSTSENHKLRCPRCDSSNTKFCYYNNYNLTQPRHFCKTCRRYWTKGGALRNVPIGGGCRKNKGTTFSAAVGKPISATGKLKAVVSSELSKSGFINTFEHEFNPIPNPNPNPNPILWSSHPPHTSHLLSLLRATQNPNPNLNFTPNPLHLMKDQSFIAGSNMSSLGFEQQHQQQQQALGQTSSLGLCSSLWRNNLDQVNNQGMLMMSSSGNEVQRLRSSSSSSDHQANYYQITSPLMLGTINNVANTTSCSSTSASPTILDSAPVNLSSGEVGFWNQTLPWSDLAAANGSYP